METEPISLNELTGQESGIVIYAGDGSAKEIIVCNWMSAEPDTLPALSPFGNDLLFLNRAYLAAAEKSTMSFAEVETLLENGIIIWDANNDLPLFKEDYESAKFYAYSVKDGEIIIIAPDNWG